MAGVGVVQERLDKVVALIAQGLKADVCSCYVMRAGEVLELFATFGLSQKAVHLTRLRVGEGLVGEIAAHARAVALADAWSHPQFVYRPETGEDFFRSLMGVPMLQAGRVIGVLVVQTRDQRPFNDWEVETLETVAMVIAELMAAAQIVKREELFQTEGNALLPVRLTGISLNTGVGVGLAVMHKPHVRIGRLVSDDPAIEERRLQNALDALRREVDTMIGDAHGDSSLYGDILEVYRMFADDRGWISRISEVIASGLTAEAAVQKVHDDTRVRMMQVSDPILRERLQDLDDLANRLLSILAGGGMRAELPDNAILICRTIGPTELLNYDRRKLRGLVMEEGSPTMHAVVVAKALDLPVVAQVQGALSRIDAFDQIALDANAGQIILRPSDEVIDLYTAAIDARVKQKAVYAAVKNLPSVTRDGVPIALYLNAGFLMDMQGLADTNADGIGLYRTEMPFLAMPTLARCERPTGALPAGGRNREWASRDVPDPGCRRRQDRGLGRNNDGGQSGDGLAFDPPHARSSVDLASAAAGADQCQRRRPPAGDVSDDRDRERVRCGAARSSTWNWRVTATTAALPPTSVKVGTMLEVPSLLWQLDGLTRCADFISVGTNDLMQFIFAADRGNTRVANRYDTLSPTVLQMLRDSSLSSGRCGDGTVDLRRDGGSSARSHGPDRAGVPQSLDVRIRHRTGACNGPQFARRCCSALRRRPASGPNARRCARTCALLRATTASPWNKLLSGVQR